MYIGTGVLAAGIAITPMVVKNQIDTSIAQEKALLADKGLELKEIRDEGYFTSTRFLELKITDGKKLRDFFLDELVKKENNFTLYADLIKKQTNKDIDKALVGTTFEGILTHSNLLVNDIKINLSLTSLSTLFMEEMQKNEALKKVFQPIFESKLLTFDIDMTSKQEIKKIAFKDIQTTLTPNENTQSTIAWTNHFLTFDLDTPRTKGLYNIDKQKIEILDKEEIFKYNAGQFKYTFDYASQFDQVASLSLKDIDIYSKAYTRETSMHINNINIESSVAMKNEASIYTDALYSLDAFSFHKGATNITFDNSALSFAFDNIHLEGLKNLTTAYQNLYFQKTDANTQELINSLQTLLHYGANVGVKGKLKAFHYQDVALDDISLNLDTTILANTVDLKTNFKSLISFITVQGVFKAHKKDIETLLTLDKGLNKVLAHAKEEGEYMIYNIRFADKIFTINDNEIK